MGSGQRIFVLKRPLEVAIEVLLRGNDERVCNLCVLLKQEVGDI